ncbi:unnamed protein product, partial [marine sediment metagenome]
SFLVWLLTFPKERKIVKFENLKNFYQAFLWHF